MKNKIQKIKNKRIVKFVLSFLPYLLSFLFFPLPLYAQGVNNLNLNYRIPNPTTYDSLEQIINAATALIRPAFILTFAAMVLYGAWTRLTGGDDSKKIEQSQKIIVGAAIGFALAVLAPTIVSFLGKLLGVQGTLIN